MLGKVLASPRFCEGGWGEGFGVEESAFRVLSVSLSLYVCVCACVCVCVRGECFRAQHLGVQVVKHFQQARRPDVFH